MKINKEVKEIKKGFEKTADVPSLPEKYPQGYVMKGEDGDLRILYDKTWYLVREGDVVNFEIEENNDLDLETIEPINLMGCITFRGERDKTIERLIENKINEITKAYNILIRK